MRNILEDFDGVLLDMTAVEATDHFGRTHPESGLCWLNRQLEEDCLYTVRGALKTLERYTNRLDVSGEVVYGSGGMNRWLILPSGRVMFSSRHGFKATADEAQQLGFEVY